MEQQVNMDRVWSDAAYYHDRGLLPGIGRDVPYISQDFYVRRGEFISPKVVSGGYRSLVRRDHSFTAQ